VDSSTSVVLEVLKHDMWFGEIGLIKDIIRMCTVTCNEDCLFLVVTRPKVITHSFFRSCISLYLFVCVCVYVLHSSSCQCVNVVGMW
jgi:hypothetical protein